MTLANSEIACKCSHSNSRHSDWMFRCLDCHCPAFKLADKAWNDVYGLPPQPSAAPLEPQEQVSEADFNRMRRASLVSKCCHAPIKNASSSFNAEFYDACTACEKGCTGVPAQEAYGLTGTVYEVKTLPNTATQLLEAVYKQKDLSRTEAREMAAYLDERYGMSDYVPVSPQLDEEELDRILRPTHKMSRKATERFGSDIGYDCGACGEGFGTVKFDISEVKAKLLAWAKGKQ